MISSIAKLYDCRVIATATRRVQISEQPCADDAQTIRAGLSALVTAVDGYRSTLTTRYGLGVADITAIGLLLDDEPLRAAQIARRCGLTAGSATALLDRLVARGYVSRTRPPENRRVIEVTLTDAGRSIAHEMRDPVAPHLARLTDRGRSAETVAGVLHDVAASLEALSPPADGTDGRG